MRPDTLGVIGLGAIGGSVAWQAGVAGVPRVLGFSPFPAEGAAAVRAGAVTDLAPTVRHVFVRGQPAPFNDRHTRAYEVPWRASPRP